MNEQKLRMPAVLRHLQVAAFAPHVELSYLYTVGPFRVEHLLQSHRVSTLTSEANRPQRWQRPVEEAISTFPLFQRTIE